MKNMVEDLQHAVPEELYNLTQLAEVAIKLSTDIDQIKKYIGKSDTEVKEDYESTKKKWKNHWETSSESPQLFLEDKRFLIGPTVSPDSLSSSSSSTSTTTLSYLNLSSSSSVVSSDDDSAKSVSSYSHKIFDRKKQRIFRDVPDAERSLPGADKRLMLDESGVNCYDSGLVNDQNQNGGTNGVFNKLDSNIISNEPNTNELYAENSHQLGLSEDVHICPECGKKYSTSSNLARHRQTHR